MTRAVPTLDPVTLEVVRNQFEGIANQMELTLLRSSFSPIIKESMDASASLFTRDGDTLAQATSLPIHLATMIPAVGSILDTFPLDTMCPGDAYILNDPYSGGTHLPDLVVVMPIFFGDRVVALSATMAHHQDVGGMTPGSVPTNATEIFQEGVCIPPLKLRSIDGYDRTLTQMLKQNVRIPEVFMGDLNAQVAACAIGARRMASLAETYGFDLLASLCDNLLDRSECMTREALRHLPEGTYSYVDHLDNDGVDLNRRVRMEVQVTVDEEGVLFDFTGTSQQVKGPFNCVPSGILAAACFVVRAITDSSIPTNGGCFRPIRLHLPEGSLVNPKHPAPVNSRASTVKLAAGCMLGAFRQAIPEKLPASDAVDMHAIAWGGQRADGQRYVVSESIGSGSGASAWRDGVDGTETDCTNCMNQPVEALEMEAPIRIWRSEIRQDSGGEGRHRGGLGIRREYELLEGNATLTHRGERFYSQAPGSQGGGAGASSRSIVLRADGTEELIPSKAVLQMSTGDRLIVETPGGGGFGKPEEREANDVQADIRNRKVSAGRAQSPIMP